MRYTYQGLRDWAIAQYSMIDTVRQIETTADSHRMVYWANKPVELGLTTNIFPNGLQLEYLLLKDLLGSNAKRELPLNDGTGRTCKAEASYDANTQEGRPYALQVIFPCRSKQTLPVLDDIGARWPSSQHWLVSMQAQKDGSNATLDTDNILARHHITGFTKVAWDAASKESAYLCNSGGDGDIYRCHPRSLEAYLDAADDAFNRIVLTTPQGTLQYRLGTGSLVTSMRTHDATDLLCVCGVLDRHLGQGTPASQL